ncbi:MAG: ABC transporter substrate-binding protein [Geminicoccaceae bacterium]|nr:ABC transporter substrate-binding protein [Geminicoccaceae bacterium]
MKNNTLSRSGARLAAALGATAISAALLLSGASSFAQEDNVQIGLVTPMAGANARFGGFALRGMELAIKEINEAGGVNGRMLELSYGDSQCAPVEGVSATRRLIESNEVDFILGDVCSSVTLAMQPIVEEAGVLLLNAASSNPQITYGAGVGGFEWTFRNYITDEIRARAVQQFAYENRGYTKFAVLSVDSDFGRGAINFARKYLPEFNGEIVSEDYYREGEVDFRSVLTKIKNSGAEAIIMYGLGDTTPVIGRQMIELGMAGKIPLIGDGEFNASNTLKAAGKAMEGAIQAIFWLPTLDSERSLEFVENYKAEYGGEEPNNHAYSHWDSTHLLAEAIKIAGSAEPEAVQAALEENTFESAVGTVKFDDHHQAKLPMILLEIVDGEIQVVGSVEGDINYPPAN